MSYSNPKLENPIKKYIEYSGDTGEFRYWDKEKKENVILTMPLYFIVLDELSGISGYSETLQSGIYSNEVRNLKDDIFTVRAFKTNLKIVGTYEQVKAEAKNVGGRFTKLVYAMLFTGDKENKQFELVCFKLKGAAFAGWMDKSFNVNLFGVICQKHDKKSKGGKKKIEWLQPVFESFKIPQELHSEAIAKDKILQKWFKQRVEQATNEQVAQEEVPHIEFDTAEDALFDGHGNVNNPDAKASVNDDELPF